MVEVRLATLNEQEANKLATEEHTKSTQNKQYKQTYQANNNNHINNINIYEITNHTNIHTKPYINDAYTTSTNNKQYKHTQRRIPFGDHPLKLERHRED